uniref:Mos1 transposase HTH domain-containing protein n=1 Tax=Glossina palpalis gambiensis TaxID=67801 RepID=A0A1B0C2B5_9MUSC
MSESKLPLRQCILYEFQKGSHTLDLKKKLYDVFGKHAVTVLTCQRWLAKIRLDDFSLKNKPKSGRPPVALLRDSKGIVRHELLERNDTGIDRYCARLDVLNKEIQPKRPSLNIRKCVIKKIRVDSNTHNRHVMLYHSEKRWKAAQSFCDINELLRELTISESRCGEYVEERAIISIIMHQPMMNVKSGTISNVIIYD